MRDKFRRLAGNPPKEPTPTGPEPTLPPATQLPSPNPVPPVGPSPNPRPNLPPVSKPVQSVIQKKPGHHATEPLVGKPEPSPPNVRQQAADYLQRLQQKINQLADDFAEGVINREQFQRLYEHYQRERRGVEALLSTNPSDEELRAAIGEGQSVAIRKQHVARAQGYAIYENGSGMPIANLGKFEVDPATLVPLISSFRTAAEVMGGIRSTSIAGGRWLCFVPGQFTTLLALFTTEPAQKQQAYLEDVHRLFEKANRHKLTRSPIDLTGLLFPHEFFLKK